MASRFSISESDLVPDYILRTVWNDMRTDPETYDRAGVLEIVEPAENLFVSEMGGMLTESANITLAKPQVMLVVVWQAHMRRASEADLTVPKDVTDAKEQALKWARTIGRRLLEEEGNTYLPERSGVEYDADDANYSMSDLNKL